MKAAFLAWLNKQRVEYRPAHVCGGCGGGGLEDFARPATPRGSAGGLDRGKIGAAGQGGKVRTAPFPPTAQNQALSAMQLGQVARIKSHWLGKVADFCGFRWACRLMASFATWARSIGKGGAGALDQVRPAGGGFPLSPPASPPYPGRAGQTQDLEKPAQGPACIAGCTSAAEPKARKVAPIGMGSGVGVVARVWGSARETGRGGGIGLGFGAVVAGHIQLDRGNGATLGRGAR